MKLIEPKVELIQQAPGLVGMYKHIEKCARTCYKSEDNITEDSYKKMYDNLVKRGHLAMLEHGTVYLKHDTYSKNFELELKHYCKNPYSKYKVYSFLDEYSEYITTNLRVIIENHWEDDLEFICEPTKFHERRITLKFTTNIGVTREGNRHRVNSIAEESTRYCNYTKKQFGSELNITRPVWINKESIPEFDESQWLDCIKDLLIDGINPDYIEQDTTYWYCMAIEFAGVAYRNLIRLGWPPQQAREVLPLATKSEVVYTAFASDWKHWFDLRLVGITGKPHPNTEQVAWLAQQELIKNNLWDLIYHDNKHE